MFFPLFFLHYCYVLNAWNVVEWPETHYDHVAHRHISFPDQLWSIPEGEGVDREHDEEDEASANSSKQAPSYPRLLCLSQVNLIPVVKSTITLQASKPNLLMWFLNKPYTFSAQSTYCHLFYLQ